MRVSACQNLYLNAAGSRRIDRHSLPVPLDTSGGISARSRLSSLIAVNATARVQLQKIAPPCVAMLNPQLAKSRPTEIKPEIQSCR